MVRNGIIIPIPDVLTPRRDDPHTQELSKTAEAKKVFSCPSDDCKKLTVVVIYGVGETQDQHSVIVVAKAFD
jgi:hypothetical protein